MDYSKLDYRRCHLPHGYYAHYDERFSAVVVCRSEHMPLLGARMLVRTPRGAWVPYTSLEDRVEDARVAHDVVAAIDAFLKENEA